MTTVKTNHQVQKWINTNVQADLKSWNHPNDAYRIYSHYVGDEAVVQKIFTWHLNKWAEDAGAQRARRKGYKGWRARINGAENFVGKPGHKVFQGDVTETSATIESTMADIDAVMETDGNRKGADMVLGDADHWKVRMAEEGLTEGEMATITTRKDYLQLDVEDTIQDVIAARDLPSTSPADVVSAEPERTEPMPIPELQDDAKAVSVAGMLVLKEGMTDSQRKAAAVKLYQDAKDLFDELKPTRLIKARKRASKQFEFDDAHKSVRENYAKFVLWAREKTMTRAEMLRYARFSRDDKASPLDGENGPDYWMREENYLAFAKHTVPFKKWYKQDTHPGVIREMNEKLKRETDTWLERELRRSLKHARSIIDRGMDYWKSADVIDDIYMKRMIPLWIYICPEGNDWLRNADEGQFHRLANVADISVWNEIFAEIDAKGLRPRLLEMWQTGEYKPFSYVQWVPEE